MEISITSQSKKDYLLIETKANIESKEKLMKQSQLIYEEIIKHPFKKILIDERETQLPISLYAFFDLVKGYVDDFPPEIHDLKIATVVALEYKEVAATWETLCVSRKLNYFDFTSLEDAEKWLLKDSG